MFASLPMYDRPETRGAHDLLWALIRDGLRDRGIAAPDHLDRDTHHMTGWARPDLVLGQICNLPYRARFRGKVTLIGAADYGLPDVPPGYYDSVFVVRSDDAATDPAQCRDHRFAYNEGLSNSGWGAPQVWAAAHGFAFTPFLHTGAHIESLRAVATSRADIAGIDAVSWRMFRRWAPETAHLRVIGRTQASPGMTFITGPGRDPAPFFTAIADAVTALPDPARDTLGLRGIVALSPAAYDLPLPPLPAHPTAAPDK